MGEDYGPLPMPFVPDFEGCIPMERMEDLVGCEVTVAGGVRFVPNLSSAPFDGQVHVSGIQNHDARELYLQLPDRTFVRLTEASRITGWVRSQKVLQSVVTFHDLKDLSLDEQELYRRACVEADAVRIPKREGAAVRLANDAIVCGHVMWGDILCPEAKVLKHVQDGAGELPDVRKIALSGSSDTFDDPDPLAPCGSCRQRILRCQEAACGPIVILFQGGYSQVARVENVEALLPFARVGVAK